MNLWLNSQIEFVVKFSSDLQVGYLYEFVVKFSNKFVVEFSNNLNLNVYF